MESKKPWESRTLWANLIMASVAFIPGVGELISGNAEVAGIIVTGVNVILRLITKGKIEIK